MPCVLCTLLQKNIYAKPTQTFVFFIILLEKAKTIMVANY